LILKKHKKKQIDRSSVEFLTMEEGLYGQSLYIGSFDFETKTIAQLNRYLSERGYQCDLFQTRLHHEIDLSDPRKVVPEKRKTGIRLPMNQTKKQPSPVNSGEGCPSY